MGQGLSFGERQSGISLPQEHFPAPNVVPEPFSNGFNSKKKTNDHNVISVSDSRKRRCYQNKVAVLPSDQMGEERLYSEH